MITQGSLTSFTQASTPSICSHQPREQLREGHRESHTARRPGTFSYNIRVVQHIEPPPQHLHPQKAQLLCKTPVSLIIWIRAHPRPTCPYRQALGRIQKFLKQHLSNLSLWDKKGKSVYAYVRMLLEILSGKHCACLPRNISRSPASLLAKVKWELQHGELS